VNAAERVEAVLASYPTALSFDHAILIAAAEAAGSPLDPRQPDDAAVLLHAEGLLQQGLTVLRALARARIAAEAPALNLHTRDHGAIRAAAEPSLDDLLRHPRFQRLADRVFRTSRPSRADGTDLVLFERHQVGPHAIELWGPPAAIRQQPTPSTSPAGQLIGTCLRCGGGVGDRDLTVGYHTSSGWKYSGHGLPDAKAALLAKYFLCWVCAVRSKHKLIRPPEPDIQSDSRTDANGCQL
jgi:hypothetical protein